MTYIFEKKKPFFLIKMCDKFRHATTEMIIGGDIMYVHWDPGTPMDSGLVTDISTKFNKVCKRGSHVQKSQEKYENDLAPAPHKTHTTKGPGSALMA